ncbi:hypothetical protein PQQ75_25125 [Paraburkholderia aspalathi]|uniref:hypothetical protein n=1 Tax=Paraburkholderia aspalathi TaxID=1324617 RepID=UPI0038B9C2A9
MTTDHIPKINDGGPAFARPLGSTTGRYNDSQPGMTLRAYLAAHADVSEFDLEECIFEMRAGRATYTNEPASIVEVADAIADLKVMLADAIIRRLARGEA